MNIAQYIDHTVLKLNTENSDVTKVCEEAVTYQFAAVCVPPVYVQKAKKALQDSSVKTATVIGFPFGYHSIQTKFVEAKEALENGADELDLVMNMTAFKNKEWKALEAETIGILKIVKEKNALLKIIIESGILSEDEIVQCCTFYQQFPVDFLKTSTGYAERGATVEAVQLMRAHLPSSIQIKASGGIKTYETALQFIKAGVTRLGCSAGVAIVKEEPASNDDY